MGPGTVVCKYPVSSWGEEAAEGAVALMLGIISPGFQIFFFF